MRPSFLRRRLTPFSLLAMASAAALAFGVLSGFFGAYVPLFDTAAHFRVHFSLGLLLLGLLLLLDRRFAGGLAALAVAGIALFSVSPFMLPGPVREAPPGAPRYTLLQMNLRYDAPDKGPALRLIGEVRPDVITAEEITPDWIAAFAALKDRYPFQFSCMRPDGDNDVLILSRRPFAEGDAGYCDNRVSFGMRQVDFNGLAVTVAGLHLRWPWPGRQGQLVADLTPVLLKLQDPLILAGDFNAAPWSANVTRVSDASRTQIVGGIGFTWFTKLVPGWLARYVGLPIDNVLVSPGIEVLSAEALPATASDHLPVLVTFTLSFAPSSEEPETLSAAR